jgi:hypothetical protein
MIKLRKAGSAGTSSLLFRFPSGEYAARAYKTILRDYNLPVLHSSYAFMSIAALRKRAYVEASRCGTPPILPRRLFPSGGFLTFIIQAGLLVRLFFCLQPMRVQSSSLRRLMPVRGCSKMIVPAIGHFAGCDLN